MARRLAFSLVGGDHDVLSADAHGLSMTACNMLYRVRLKAPGIRPGPTL
jgi:hypothetical protein